MAAIRSDYLFTRILISPVSEAMLYRQLPGGESGGHAMRSNAKVRSSA
jgi:hypothetical protein